MKQHSTNRLWGRLLAWTLAAALLFSNLEGATFVHAEGEKAAPTEIKSAEDLQKIGTDANYPMTGDYVLTDDIDLSGRDWKPMGGHVGNKGTCNPMQANVFSGTFDGQGHVISGLTINLSDSINQNGKYGQVGLFSVIGSNNADDYAEVKNIIFTDVDIRTDFPDGLATVGTLAGEVNGYANISGIVVVDGSLTVNPSKNCDTVGAGGIIGECRTADGPGNNNFISVKDCYNGADVYAYGTVENLIYTAGIVGRVAYSACKAITQCVNTGIIQYEGYDAFGIATAQNENKTYLSTLTDCYFPSSLEQQSLTAGATAVKDKELTGGTLPGNLSADIWQAVTGCYPVPSFCLTSSAAGRIYLSGLSLEFAEGESASGVKTEIALPQTAGTDAINWSSSAETALTIEGTKAVAHPAEIGMKTTVMLTAVSEKGYSRSFKVVVLPDIEQVASFEQAYAKVGTPLTVSVSNLPEGTELNYQWSVGGTAISNSGSSYTPSENDLEKFISVVITNADGSVSWNLSIYCSELPVVYVDTNDGQGVNSNTVAKDAVMKIQGNDEFSDSAYWYDGKTTIKGRGNSTWSEAVAWNVKKPYKLKLDKKANLLGLGTNNKKASKNTNKHWVLLANMIDHTNMRNEIAYNFSKDIGMEVSMGTTNVVLILNGEYQGIYELAEHVRVGSARVNVHDWEDQADDIAEAICLANPTLKQSSLETQMEEDYSWVTTKEVTFGGETYRISDYYTEEIPEVTGGFLLDMDFRSLSNQYKYISTFQTQYGNIPMFFRAPEYARTSEAMMSFAKNYLDAYEAALRSPDFTTSYNEETVHYTELFDMDSLLQYWLLCEYVNNWDSMKNSTYLYKDLTGKAKMGPAWDYDWAWGNINMYSSTGPFVYDKWHTTLCGMGTYEGGFAEQGYQREQWNRYLVRDPYFVTKAYEFYKKYRPTVIEDIMKKDGTIDTLQKKYSTASLANDKKWSYSYGRYSGFAFVNGQQTRTQSQTYDAAVASLRTFIEKRVDWMDKQFTSVEALYQSLGNQVSSKITVTAAKDAETGTVTATANVTDNNVNGVAFLINGKKAEVDGKTVIPLAGGKATITVDADLLETSENVMNTIEVLGVQGSSYVSGAMNFTNDIQTVEPGKDPKPEQLTGTVNVTSSRTGDVSYPGDMLKAEVSENCNNTGTLSYQWYAGEEAITGAVTATYVLTDNEIGKRLTVEVTSSVETGKITGTYNGTIMKETVTETIKATGINLSVTSKKLYAYQTLQLKATVKPKGVSQNVTYDSDKKSVATVSKTGKITAKAPGKAKITVKAADGSGTKAICTITVLKPVIKVSGKTSVKRNKSITLTAKTYGLKGKVKWKLDAKGKKLLKLSKSSGSKVKLTAKKKTGTAKLTITCGKTKVTKTIRVKK